MQKPLEMKNIFGVSILSDFVFLFLVFPHPYMVLPVSQSLLVQLVPALCPDYVPGVLS